MVSPDRTINVLIHDRVTIAVPAAEQAARTEPKKIPSEVQRLRDELISTETQRYIQKLVAKRLGSTDDATQDVLQEILIRADEALKRGVFKIEGGNFRGWLGTLTYNYLNTEYHKHSRRIVEELIGDRPNPKIDQEVWMSNWRVLELIKLLPEEFQETCRLWYVEDLEYADIAKAVGIPIGTVMSRLNRAKQKLKKLVKIEARQYEQKAA